MAAPLLSIRDLEVEFAVSGGTVHAVRSVSLNVAQGETLAIVGESGSGKSQLMMAALGLLASNGCARGSVLFHREEILGKSERDLDRIRGARIGMIFQEPMTSLDPLYRIGHQIALTLRRHQNFDKGTARARALELLRLVRIPDPERRIDSYPHELSGGQRQRVMIAMAIANDPDLLIADEPTTALDVTVQAQILALLAELKQRLGMAIVFITHDLNIVRRFADCVAVMHDGKLVEGGPTSKLFAHPREAYTRNLIAAEPAGRKPPVAAEAPVLLEARNIRIAFRLPRRLFQPRPPNLVAVDNVSLDVRQGQTLGIVGESGSGKSTLGRALLRLFHGSGTVTFAGRRLDHLTRPELRLLRRDLGVVFQDPFGSLSPRLTVGEIISEGLLVHEPSLGRRQRDKRAAAALTEVRLDPAMRNRYPHEFSGGQRQRIAIARAMVLRPRLLLLDEPTSSLDRTVQKTIVDLLRDLQHRFGMTYLFISHDLAVVRAMADRIIVMKDGRVVEAGTTDAILSHPEHPYTRELMAAAFTAQP
jgi:ABC-type microcin C transport system duplicated ATPase subunit YejF